MAKGIMIQGTMSSAGKSLICAALCRIFKQDGLRTAPFKSQNMALNSFITRNGLEMGRAQVMQAEAAGVEPDVRMNPILLKPTSDVGSQVIVNGEVLGNMPAAQYFAYKKYLVPDILKAYGSLAEEYDVIVTEGAGSPAEINLKSNDIVNMGLAAMIDVPVLLAGDIDRGGVFAQLYGTVGLLEPEERQRVKGLIINKFRGDEQILKPGLEMLEEITGVPVAGVIPYLDVVLDDEDSLAPRLSRTSAGEAVDVAVVRLPHISNFTDFGALEQQPGIGLRYVTGSSGLGSPDLIILPGTKNTMADLSWLRQCGLEAAIQKCVGAGTPLMGICGGYQMLGETLSDPERVETGGEMRGMGLLPVHTVFTREKVRTRVTGAIFPQKGFFGCLDNADFSGYEIHMGKTRKSNGIPAFSQLRVLETDGELDWDPGIHGLDISRPDGAVLGNVMGTYVHGIFDEGSFCRALCRKLLRGKGISEESLKPFDYAAFKERQYDILADAVRKALDMEKIYRILEKGGR